MTRTRAPWILAEAAASGAGRSSWLACTPPVGLALLAVLYAWISGMTVLGDALLILIKVAAALLAVAWAAAALPRRFGRGSRPGAMAAALAIFGLGAAGAVWMFPGVWVIPSVPLALPTLGIAGTIPAVYIIAPALACAGGYIAYRRFSGFQRSAVTQGRERIAADSPRGVAWVRKPRPPKLERPRRAARLPEAPTEPVELRIALAIPPGEDDDAAAALATKAMAEMTHGEGVSPVCARQRTAAGGVVLDIRFHVRDIRRGRAHVLADAQARLWDVLHTHSIPFALRATPIAERARDKRQRMTDPLWRACDVRQHSVGSGIPAIGDAVPLRGRRMRETNARRGSARRCD